MRGRWCVIPSSRWVGSGAGYGSVRPEAPFHTEIKLLNNKPSMSMISRQLWCPDQWEGLARKEARCRDSAPAGRAEVEGQGRLPLRAVAGYPGRGT